MSGERTIAAQTILMVASTSFFSDYGNHVRIYEEMRVLQQRGHRVVLATYHNGDDLPGLTIERSWDVPWIKRAVVGSSRHKLYLDVGLGWRALRSALRLRPTVLHAHTHEAAAVALPLQVLLQRPLILDYQGSMTAEMLDHRFLRAGSPLHAALRRLEAWINRRADAVTPSTANAAAQLRAGDSVADARIVTVADGVDTDRFRPFDGSPEWTHERLRLRAELGIPAGRRIVVYIGLLAPYQGTNLLLESAQTLCAERDDLHFLVMGHPDPHSYRRLAADLGIADRVTLPGRIFYRDLHSYLALGDIAVAPKMSMTEGNGKVANYMAMGLPIVAFDTPVNREMLADDAYYAAAGDRAAFTAALRRALNEPAHAAACGAAGRRRALEHLSWQRSADRIEAVYRTVLQRRGLQHLL
jgi:glycosyltransferase involved in cell wall biosynthesis